MLMPLINVGGRWRFGVAEFVWKIFHTVYQFSRSGSTVKPASLLVFLVIRI